MKKAELLIHRISPAFISLFVYLYNIMLIRQTGGHYESI